MAGSMILGLSCFGLRTCDMLETRTIGAGFWRLVSVNSPVGITVGYPLVGLVGLSKKPVSCS